MAYKTPSHFIVDGTGLENNPPALPSNHILTQCMLFSQFQRQAYIKHMEVTSCVGNGGLSEFMVREFQCITSTVATDSNSGSGESLKLHA